MPLQESHISQVSQGLYNSLPNDTIFQQLFRAASQVHHPILYTRNGRMGVKANANPHSTFSIDYPRFFADVMELRQNVRSHLPPAALDHNGVLRTQGCYICTLSGGDYAFIVAFYAALSIGAAVAPLDSERYPGGRRALLSRPRPGQHPYHLARIPYGDIEAFWRLIQDIPFETIAVTPPVLKELREYYDQNIRILPLKEVEEHLHHLRNRTKRLISSGSMIEQNILDFWWILLGKHIICNAYAMTEAGWITITDLDSTLKGLFMTLNRTRQWLIPDKHSIGKARDWATIKLSDGDCGEALIKSHTMFSGYLNNDKASAEVFNEEGYFRSGDVLRRVGDEYIYEGRIATDFILFYGYKIPTLDLEKALLQLPYIQDAGTFLERPTMPLKSSLPLLSAWLHLQSTKISPRAGGPDFT